VYHVLNRANGKRRIFEHDRDYLAFERVLAEVQERVPMRILAWCVMPNHWHLLLWPRRDGDLSNYMRLVTLTHTQRRHANRASAGTGHLYQGRFKLVQRAEEWRWGSLWRMQRGKVDQPPRIDPWPVTRPTDWLAYVNQPAQVVEVDALRRWARRGSPYGDGVWVACISEQLGLKSTLRPRGRPAKEKEF